MSKRKQYDGRRPLFALTVGCAVGFGVAGFGVAAQTAPEPWRLLWPGLSMLCWIGALLLLSSVYRP